MTRSIRSLALEIAQILEDHTEKEIRDAVDMLCERGYGSALLEFLARANNGPAPTKRGSRESLPRKPLDKTTSRSVLNLREAEPDKFRVLSEFDLMVRRGQILTTPEALRRFGERLSKDFEPRRSRKETISPLMSVMAARSLHEIERLVEYAASFGVSGETDEYQKLAQFIIKGKE